MTQLKYEAKVLDEAIRIAKDWLGSIDNPLLKNYLIGQLTALEAEKLRAAAQRPETGHPMLCGCALCM